MGRGNFPEFPYRSGDLPEVRDGLGDLPEIQDGSGNHSGGWRRVGGHSQRSKTGRQTLPEVRDGS